MPSNIIVAPFSLSGIDLPSATRAAEAPSAVLLDEWRQIDRWVNEGGAERRATALQQPSTRREP